MITWLNTPFEDVIQATKNLYGNINCEILIDPELAIEEECYGMTQWTEEGRVLITLDGRTSIERLVETLGHELAHVVVDRTEKDDHGPIWEEVFDNIFKEYNRYCERKYSDKNKEKATYKGCRGALEFIADIAYGYDNSKSVKALEKLIDEIRTEALRALELGEGYKI